jgi:uncharacterized membrane protein YbhN (UPF0104 family)
MISSEAVLMSFPGGMALADGVNPYLLHRRLGIPIPAGIAAAATRKIAIVFTNGLYVGIAVLFGARYLRAGSRALLGGAGLEWLTAALAVGMLVGALAMARALFSGDLAVRSRGLLGRIPSARLRAFLDDRRAGFLEADAHLSSLLRSGFPALGGAAALLLGAWLAEGADTYVILRLLGVDISYAEVLAFEVVVSLLRSVAFVVPGALGVLDAGYVAFLRAFGVPDAPTVGFAFVLVKRAKEVFWIAVGFAFFVVLRDAPRALPREGPP